MSAAADTDAAIAFLRSFFGEQPWNLTAIWPQDVPLPENWSRTAGMTFDAEHAEQTATWIRQKNGFGYNVYFAPNPLSERLGEKRRRGSKAGQKRAKATKDEVAEARWLWADLDPHSDDDDLDALLAEVELPDPTLTLDSGRGRWAFWRLAEPVALDGEKGEQTALVEAHARGIREVFANRCADSVPNTDRIARLPGTVNHKNGRLARVLIYEPDRVFSLGDFPAHNARQRAQRAAVGSPSSLPDRIRRIVRDGRGDEPKSGDDTRSAWLFDAVCGMVRAGWNDDAIVATITDPENGASASVLDKDDPEDYARRQAESAREAVAASDVMVDGLTIVESRPPLYTLHVGDVRIEGLTVAELMSWTRVKHKIVEHCQDVPQPTKQKDWEQRVKSMLQAAERVPPAASTTEQDVFFEVLEDFLGNTASAQDRSELWQGKVFLDPDKGRFEFRLSDLMMHLDRHNFREWKRPRIAAELRDLGGGSDRAYARGRGVNIFWVPEGLGNAPPESDPPPSQDVPI